MKTIITKERLMLKITPMVAFIDGVDMLLAQKEFSLLQFFIKHENRVLTADYIYEQVWGQPANNDVKVVKSHISRLRKKLENSGYTILSTRGEGYCFELV